MCGRTTVMPEGASLAPSYITGAEIAGAVRLIPEGKVALTDDLTNYLAQKYGGHSVTLRGPMHARGRAEEDEIPYWRLLNPKGCMITRKWFMPNHEQGNRLNLEGHELFIDSRNRVHVIDYKDKLFHFS